MDFFLYGDGRGADFQQAGFFPTFDPMVGTLLAFATLNAGLIFSWRGLWAVWSSVITATRSAARPCCDLTLLIMGTATAVDRRIAYI